MKQVFLGGTCGANHWREEIVVPGLLERGIAPEQIFNPVVAHWTPADQEREDEAKRTYGTVLFTIASVDPAREDVKETSAYSMVEATRAALKYPERTVIMIDTTGLNRRTAKGINKAAQDWQEDAPELPIFRDYDALVEWLAARLREE